MSSRINKYKNAGLDNQELRRRREEAGVQIRKAKREEQLSKRRHVVDDTDDAESSARKLTNLPDMIEGILSDDDTVQLENTRSFRQLLSKDPNPPIDAVIEANIIPRLVSFLQRVDSGKLQFEAAWALTNVASGTSAQTLKVVEAGAVPFFIQLLSSPHEDVQEQSVWALGNIAGDSPDCRNFILDSGILQPLLELLNTSTKASMTRNAVWCLSNLCRGKNPPPDFEKVSPGLPTIARLLFHHDGDVLADTCWALAYLSDGPNDKIQAVLDAGICRRLVELLMHQKPNVVSATLRGVGNIVTGDDVQTQVVLNCAVLPSLMHLLHSNSEVIRKETCWALSNITAGNRNQIQAVIDANFIPALVSAMEKSDFKTRKEAAWAITNATSGGSPQQIQYIASQEAIGPLCDLLSVLDPKIVLVAMTGLDNILHAGDELAQASADLTNPYAVQLEECFGLDKIEFLQQHENEEVYRKAYQIIETYFRDDDPEVDQEIAPQTSADGQHFEFVPNDNLSAPAGGFMLS